MHPFNQKNNNKSLESHTKGPKPMKNNLKEKKKSETETPLSLLSVHYWECEWGNTLIFPLFPLSI